MPNKPLPCDGNSLLNFKEVERECAFCGGVGKVERTKQWIEDYCIEQVQCDTMEWEEVAAIYEQWKKTGTMNCVHCLGEGKWTERI